MDQALHIAAPPQGVGELSEESAALKLKDGRALGFRSYGPQDGVPAFYFHGFPGSRLEAGFAAAPGIRLIAVDRPGYGLSGPLPRRQLSDWPPDVASLADYLGFKRFAVLGVSGGAPYALACARYLPERLAATALICGIGPRDIAGMNTGLMRNLMRFGRNRIAYMPLVQIGRMFLRRKDAEARFLAFRRRMNERLSADVPKEMAVCTDDLSRHLFKSWSEGLRRSMSGMISDARIYSSPWPFSIGEIAARVHLWHGTEDRIVPVAVGHALERVIPDVSAHFEEGEGHFSVILNKLPDVVRTLREAHQR